MNSANNPYIGCNQMGQFNAGLDWQAQQQLNAFNSTGHYLQQLMGVQNAYPYGYHRDADYRRLSSWICSYCKGHRKADTDECIGCGAPRP